MRVKLFASVVALALLGSVSGFTVSAQAYDSASTQGRIDIARIKSVLKLTPEQQHYWPAVESALRSLARQQTHQVAEQSDGMVRRVSNRVYAFVMDSATIARVGAAARPLVKVLDDRQKQDAIALCHEMGLGQVLAALM
jgi:c-di-AMP phosphodiesterase-like protein